MADGGDMYIGGKVGIDIVPVTKGFREKVRAAMRDFGDVDIPVNFNPDTARVREELRRFEREEPTIHANVKTNVDDAAFAKSFDKLRREAAEAGKSVGDSIDMSAKSGLKRFADKVDEGRESLARMAGESRSLTASLEKAQKAGSEKLVRKIRTELDAVTKSIDKTRRSLRVLDSQNERTAKSMSSVSKQSNIMRDAINGNSVFISRLERSASMLQNSYAKTAESMTTASRVTKAMNETLDKSASGMLKTSTNTLAASRSFAKAREDAAGFVDRLKQMDRELSANQKAINNTRMAGVSGLFGDLDAQATQLRDWVRDTIRDVNRSPELLNISPQIEKNITDQYVKVDLDLTKARERLDRFKRENDELKLDLDFETKLASAHLAALTRPRTVDIIAQVKTTSAGRILNGITAGATGIKGVQNQFDKLVDTFDNLDRFVPRVAMLGSVLNSVGAGALNLSRSVGGAGVSLLTMSKAALAAPAALSGLAAAGYGVAAAVKTAGDEFDVTKTKLNGLQKTVGGAFWDQARKPLTELANSIAPTLRSGLSGIASEEGRVTAGLANMVRQGERMEDVSRILTRTRSAVALMGPGLTSMASSFLTLGDVTSQYLPRMASYMSRSAESFAQWVSEAERSGEIERSLERAAEQAGYLKSSFGSLAGIVRGTFGTLAADENGIQGFSESLERANRAVQSFKFQSTLREWAAGAQGAQNAFRTSFSEIGSAAYQLRGVTNQVFTDSGRIMASAITGISRAASQSEAGISRFSSGVTRGMQSMFDAIGDAGPMFSEIASMVGELSSTFGGTFSNTLRAAAPIIESLAKGAELMAKAFGALPAPVQAAIGLWATFGRSGLQAFTSLKTGMLTSIQQTLEYRSTLAQLGLQADKAKLSFIQLAQAMAAVNTGSGVGALSNVEKSMTGAATATAVVGRNAQSAGKGLGTVGRAASGIGSKLKGAATGLMAITGISPAMLGVGAAIGVASVAIADYNQKATATKAGSEALANGLREVTANAEQAATSLGVMGSVSKDNFTNADFGEDGVNWLSDMATGFDDSSSAAKQLGLDLGDVSKAVAGSESEYEALRKKLVDTSLANTEMDVTGTGVVGTLNRTKGASDKLLTTYKKQREELTKSAKQMAVANGYSESYVDSLLKQGESFDQIGAKLMSATDKQKMASQAASMLAQSQEQASSANIQAAQAASSYGNVLDSMGSAIKQVQALGTQNVWDKQANDLNYMSEAGRVASNALTQLASSGNDYLQSMIASGASVDEVIAKQGSMRSSFINTATAMGVPKAAAKQLADQYLMTPTEIETAFKAKVETAETDMIQYASLIRDTFPDGKGTAMYKAIVNAITSGAVTDIQGVQNLANQYASEQYVSVITADGTPALMNIATVNALGIQFDGTNYTTNLDANDLASPKIDGLVTMLGASGLSGKDIKVLLDAEDKASVPIEKVSSALTRLGFSDEDINIMMNAEDNAGPKLDAVKQKLRNLGLSDKQIEFLLDAFDDASPKMDSAKAKASAFNGTTADATLGADDNDLTTKVANAKFVTSELNGTQVMASLTATDDVTPKAQAASGSLRSVPQWWLSILQGTDATSMVAGIARNAIKEVPILWQSFLNAGGNAPGFAGLSRGAILGVPTFWASILNASGNTSSFAAHARGSVVSVPRGWSTLLNAFGNTASIAGQAKNAIRNVPQRWASSIVASVSGLSAVQSLGDSIRALKNKTISVVTQFFTKGKKDGAATGGRISGPGTGTSDSIPMMLSNGEGVIKAASLRKLDAKYGASLFNTINATGDLPASVATASLKAARSQANWSGLDLDKVNGLKVTVNVPTNSGGDELMRELLSEIRALPSQMGPVIAANQMWTSKRTFDRDVRGALV